MPKIDIPNGDEFKKLTLLVDKLLDEKFSSTNFSLEFIEKVRKLTLSCLYLQIECCGCPTHLEAVTSHEINRITNYLKTGRL